jgi:ABC-2 type transport system ATP-binding protein
MDRVIATHGLTKRYSGKAVVDRLDLGVPRGAIYALLGDNGAGKSTTIRMLTGLVPADAGRAQILGQDCWADAIELRYRVGYVPEKPRFYDWMTVKEIGAFSAGFHRPGFLARYLALVQRFRLEAKAKLRTLSKGGYAKVGLALALAPDPEVLILDEPTSGLDLFTRREFLASMVDLAGEGRTILISSHGIAEVERVASHAAFLAGGRLLLADAIDGLRRRIVRVRLRHDGTPPEADELGLVLEHEAAGRQWQVVLQDPNREALDELQLRPDVSDYEETPLNLEEAYTALMTRFHRTPGGNGSGSGNGSRPGAFTPAEERFEEPDQAPAWRRGRERP